MNLGALTTTFVPKAGCNTSIRGSVYTDSTSATHKWHSLGAPSTTQCYPPGFTPAPDAFYSPGLCPQGWTSAFGSVEVIASVTETRATCCPLYVFSLFFSISSNVICFKELKLGTRTDLYGLKGLRFCNHAPTALVQPLLL